ncbi:MAG: M1 family metallopeptidase [Nocardioidaceae bacterium]
MVLRLAGGVLATATLTATSFVAAASVGRDTTGAPGAGDPYFPRYGNGGYDVRHYDISVDYRPRSERLVGDTTVTARATQRLTRFNLDLQLAASAVRVDGAPALWEQHGRELVVTPATPLRNDERFTVRVRYGGRPGAIDSGGLGAWFETADGAVLAGEPEAATLWYPSNDHPIDKASFDIRVRTARGTDVVSNGRLTGKHRVGADRVWHWRETAPMATYLAYVAFGDFTFQRGRTGGGVPYLYAISDHLGKKRKSAARSRHRSADVVDFYSRYFGAYPFDINGGTVANVRTGFALENQTRPVYSKEFFSRRGGVNTGVIAHELSHMWFGNDVSVRRWRDIWLNEGFATWSSWFYAAHRGGPSTDQQFRQAYRGLRSFHRFWRVEIGDPGPKRLFDGAVYTRGAMALEAVRNVIGNADFFRILRTWVRTRGDGNGSIGGFHRLAERLSGGSLDHVFHVWLYTEHRPAVSKRNGFPASML